MKVKRERELRIKKLGDQLLKKQKQALVDGKKLGELEGVLVSKNQKRLELENK